MWTDAGRRPRAQWAGTALGLAAHPEGAIVTRADG